MGGRSERLAGPLREVHQGAEEGTSDMSATWWRDGVPALFEACDDGHAWVIFLAPDVDSAGARHRDAIPVWEQPAGDHPTFGKIWHYQYDRAGDMLTVSPSIDVTGRYHTPNPVRFSIVTDEQFCAWEQGETIGRAQDGDLPPEKRGVDG
jgi:hypothetical protein